eukprot:5725223-Amphidinium_carterae.2
MSCADASTHGYGVHEMKWSSQDGVPRLPFHIVPRPWVWIHANTTTPKVVASKRRRLELADFTRRASDLSAAEILAEEGVEMCSHIPDVPAELLQEDRWNLLQARPYDNQHQEAIHLLELKKNRALMWGLRRKVRQSSAQGCRHLALCDNMSVTLAVEKG